MKRRVAIKKPAPVKSRGWLYNTLLSIIFFGGLVLMVFEVDIFRDTLISYTVPFFIWILTGLLLTPFFIKLLNGYASSLFLQITFNICAWGSLATYAFMALNYYLPQNKTIMVILPIEKTGQLAKGRNSCGAPYAVINYNGLEKDLIFSCDTPVENYTKVELKLQSGLWGYEVIIKKRLVK